MKKILITGKNSYVGNSLEKWLSKWKDKYLVDKISLRTEDWKDIDFSIYDVIFHVAGIAHISTKHSMKELYYKINRDLTINVAKKAREEKVKQFIFMSSMIIYGESTLKQEKVIDLNTIPKPNNFYGDSKLQAEIGIKNLENKDFHVVILRPPMIYGKNSKGNYPKLSKLSQITPIFPDIENQRSMIHIDNLCEFIRLIIDNQERGVFFPQNKEYVKTSDMVKLIAEIHGKKIKLIKVFNPIINLIGPNIRSINKLFGTLIYKKEISEYKIDYRIRSFRESIELTEK